MTFLQWFNNNLYSNLFTFITLILSGVISLGISAIYYYKGNRNNMKMNIIHPIIRLLDEGKMQDIYEKLCVISKDYTTRYMKKNERACLNKLIDAYKEVRKYDDISVDAESLKLYFVRKLEENSINPKKFPIYDQGEWVADGYPSDMPCLLEDLEEILRETPVELEDVECKEKISDLLNKYCKENYKAESLKFFAESTLSEVLKNSDIRAKWNKKFTTVQEAKTDFFNLKVAKVAKVDN